MDRAFSNEQGYSNAKNCSYVVPSWPHSRKFRGRSKQLPSSEQLLKLTLSLFLDWKHRNSAPLLWGIDLSQPQRELTTNSIPSTFLKVIWFLGSWLLLQISQLAFFSLYPLSVVHYALIQVASIPFATLNLCMLPSWMWLQWPTDLHYNLK